jgi:hypothetical protein
VLNVPSTQKSSLTHPMELLGEWVMWNLVSVRLETELVLYNIGARLARSTIGSEILLDTPDDTPK